MDERELNNQELSQEGLSQSENNESNAAKRLRLLGMDNEDKIHDESVVIKKGNFFANLWYQHKWALIIGTVLIICGVVLIISLANKPKYDIYLAYTGPMYIDAQTQEAINYSFGEMMDDYDGDGEKVINFAGITYQNDEQRKQSAEEMKANYGTVVQTSENRKALETIQMQIMSGTCAIYLMDEALYKEYEANMVKMKDILGYVPKESICAGESGVYFKETDFYYYMYATEKGRALENLPDDTVLCILPKLKTMDEDMYENSCELYKAILDFRINSEN